MNQTYEIVGGACLLVFVLSFLGWLLIRTLKRSEDPPRLIFKWVLTAGVIAYLVLKVGPLVAAGGYGGAFVGIPMTAVCGLVLAIIWRHNIAAIVAKPFANLYDGGDAEIEPRPFYSVARAQTMKGNYNVALAEIHKQLEKFPGDCEGTMLLASLLAEHLNDLPGAELTMQRWCDEPGRPSLQVAAALNQLADFHLRLAQDREAARQALEKILALFPDTEMAMKAAQRIAHLGDDRMLLGRHDRQRVAVPEGVKNLGLMTDQSHLMPVEIDPTQQAGEYVKHLAEHPLDGEAREKLAVIYAEHYHRLDLATDQLEQLIQQPNQPAKQVVHWLNLLAHLQIKHANDLAAARETLQRIIHQFPGLAAAENAQRRLDTLKLELKGQEKSQDVKLGTYEQNIGLR